VKLAGCSTTRHGRGKRPVISSGLALYEPNYHLRSFRQQLQAICVCEPSSLHKPAESRRAAALDRRHSSKIGKQQDSAGRRCSDDQEQDGPGWVARDLDQESESNRDGRSQPKRPRPPIPEEWCADTGNTQLSERIGADTQLQRKAHPTTSSFSQNLAIGISFLG
jgi:hypothetical protein